MASGDRTFIAKEESVQELLNLMGQGVTANVVKSVQHIEYLTSTAISYQSSSKITTAAKTFTISEVDITKSIIIPHGGLEGSTALKLVNSTTVSYYSNQQNRYAFAFDVVEFY